MSQFSLSHSSNLHPADCKPLEATSRRCACLLEKVRCLVERELVLVKLNAPPGPERTEVMQLLDIFRARCVDVSDRSLTICVSGDAGKVCVHSLDQHAKAVLRGRTFDTAKRGDAERSIVVTQEGWNATEVAVLQTYAMQRVLSKFGILEVARTGKISLKRGERLLEMGGWGDGHSRNARPRPQPDSGNGSDHKAADEARPQEQGGADVYAVDSNQKGAALQPSGRELLPSSAQHIEIPPVHVYHQSWHFISNCHDGYFRLFAV